MTDYLAEYDFAADADKCSLVKKWMEAEPLLFFKQLRAQRPILITPEFTLVSRFSDVTKLLKMPHVFSANPSKIECITGDEPSSFCTLPDDALSCRDKSVIRGVLNRDDLPDIRKIVSDTCVDAIKQGKGKLEAVNEYCRFVPAVFVREYFGLDGIEIDDLLHWSLCNKYDDFHRQSFGPYPPSLDKGVAEEYALALKELDSHITSLIARKMVSIQLDDMKGRYLGVPYVVSYIRECIKNGKPAKIKNDLATRVLRSPVDDEVKFDLVRKGVNIGGLLIGAIETTSQAVAQTVQFFIDRPERMNELRRMASMKNSYLFDAMVWEALRFVPISAFAHRQTSIDVTVAADTSYATEIKSGTKVLLLTQSAMFDEYAYDSPEDFNPDRNWYHHFNFGFGSHEILSKYIGMVMIPEMVRHLALLPSLHAEQSINYKAGAIPKEFWLDWQMA